MQARKFEVGDQVVLTEMAVRLHREGRFGGSTAYKYPPRTILTVVECSHYYNSDISVTPQEGLESVGWNEYWLEAYREHLPS